MEVVAATPNGNGVPPFHNHDVREWSRIDSLTGVLERARLETDHWTANTSDSSHKYGKVVDSRARSDADGALQQRARRQLEVFQSAVPGGRLQVIKSHTVSSSRWTSKPSPARHKEIAQNFGDLELSLNPLDLSSQKSKATVGRSVGRRPPSRPRSRDEPPAPSASSPAPVNLHRVSRLCHQVHEGAARHVFAKYPHQKPPIHERESGDGIEIVEVESPRSSTLSTSSSDDNNDKPKSNGLLTRTKSTSSEDLHLLTAAEKEKQPNKSIEDLEDLEQLQNWRRTSKIRRSLQFPKQNKSPTKPPDLPENTGSVRKIREDLETGRRLSTALRGNNVDLEALDQILQSIGQERPERDEDQVGSVVKKQKRNSFVTVESLQEVRGRLRRTSSPTEDIYQTGNERNKEEETDDGIVTEEMPATNGAGGQSRVRSYVYGMEAALVKKPVLGTGSLESRSSKQLNGNGSGRSEDWYNRRKSYGFEQVHGHQEPINSMISKGSKGMMESSTDSGICRSNEIMLGPSNGKEDRHQNGISSGSVKRFTSIFEQKKDTSPSSSWNQQAANDYHHPARKDFEGTITIPIVSNGGGGEDWNVNGDVKRHSIAVDESKYVTKSAADNKYRRTSLAVNEAYNPVQDGSPFEDDPSSQGKRQKKVEFCKTEVHFAAESGRVNIVATDEKPPPTNNFRRRRRNSGGGLYNQLLNEANRNGLPMLHFGDSSYEKSLLGVADQEEEPSVADANPVESETGVPPAAVATTTSTVTVSTNQSFHHYHEPEEELKENPENEAPKGILKNKPVKPKPYLLGDDNFFTSKPSEANGEESGIWGVKLKPVQSKNEAPMWRSTVTLKNTLYDSQQNEDYPSMENGYPRSGSSYRNHDEVSQPEFQKLLKNLRSTTKKLQDYEEEQKISNGYEGIRVVPTSASGDPRRSSWSVADRVDVQQKTETKGYSTKINIGGGEATVVDDVGRHPTWPRRDDSGLKDGNRKHTTILNKGLVVRIGRGDAIKSNTVCSSSKTTTDKDTTTTTTTTKITIDLSPSPKEPSRAATFDSVRLPRASLHNFKSTSLVLNTFKTEKHAAVVPAASSSSSTSIPQQLEALRKLYEDWQSDSEADKEVQSLMNKTEEEVPADEFDDDQSSVVSGSWSKMRAFRNMQQQRCKTVKETLSRTSTTATTTEINFKAHARLEKDFSNLRVSRSQTETTNDKGSPEGKAWEKQTKPLSRRTPHSPVVLRKAYAPAEPKKHHELKTAQTCEKLSSPFLVGQNATSTANGADYQQETRRTATVAETSSLQRKGYQQPKEVTRSYSPTKRSPSPVKKLPSPPRQPLRTSHSPPVRQKSRSPAPRHTSPPTQRQPHKCDRQKSPSSSMVLRTPRRSEMAYFGVKTSPSPKPARKSSDGAEKKTWSNKPDLLQHHETKEALKRGKEGSAEAQEKRPDSPIYENVDELKRQTAKAKSRARKEFDSSILDELTKAADQILQAVNAYGEESNQEEKNKRTYRKEKLDTISETKSWKQSGGGAKQQRGSSHTTTSSSKTKLKPTSSTSSVESATAEHRKNGKKATEAEIEKHRRRTNGDNSSSSSRAATKARRLQRASSREALLQSHGSSSEDLPINVEIPLRKPRLVRKTKGTQLTVTNGLVEVGTKTPSSSSKRREEKGKDEERVPVSALPEIRHKTAVSTIRSTAEKASSSRTRRPAEPEQVRKKSSSSSSKRETSGRVSQASRSDKSKSLSSREPINHHRISTANIKKCSKSEGSSTRQ